MVLVCELHGTLEHCSFCIENDTTIRAGEKPLAVCQNQKSESIKMMLGEIKTTCNIFKNSPIDTEPQPNLQIFSGDLFSFLTQHHHRGFFPSSRNKSVNWALKSTLGTKSDYKWSSRQCLILSTFYQNYCRKSSEGSHDQQIMSDGSNERLTELTRPPLQVDHLRRKLTLELWQVWSYLDMRIDSSKNRKSLVKTKV